MKKKYSEWVSRRKRESKKKRKCKQIYEVYLIDEKVKFESYGEIISKNVFW